MDVIEASCADASTALARWRADVRLRALARQAPPPTRLPPAAWAIAAAATLLLLVFLHRLSRVTQRAPADEVLHIVLRDEPAPAAEPALPEPAPHRVHATAAPVRPPVAASGADSSRADAGAPDEPAIVPHVFNPDGSIDLPREPAPRADALAATFSAPARSPDQQIMVHQRPLKVRPNHFAANFRAPSGSALTDFVADHLTASKEFTLPWGTHVKCTGVALAVAWVGGCGWYTPYKYYVPQAPWRPASVLDEQ